MLDTSTPPFDDPEVRRGLNSVIDRHQVVQIFGGEAIGLPTCQQLPPNLPGYEPYCPYTADAGPAAKAPWSAPGLDIAEAHRVVQRSGTAGMPVVLEYPPALRRSRGRVRELHGRAPRRTRIRGEREDPLAKGVLRPRKRVPDGIRWVRRRLPGCVQLHHAMFSCEGTYSPSAASTGFCDPEIDAMIDRATQLQLDDPAAAGALWAEVERAIVDQAPYVWLRTGSLSSSSPNAWATTSGAFCGARSSISSGSASRGVASVDSTAARCWEPYSDRGCRGPSQHMVEERTVLGVFSSTPVLRKLP